MTRADGGIEGRLSATPLLSGYVPGTSWLHRTPFGAKLLGVLVVGSAAWWVPSWPAAAVLTGVLVAVAVSSGLGVRRLARSLRPMALVLAVLLAYHVWASGLPEAARIVLGIANAVLAAGLLMATSSLPEILDGVTRGARPFRRVIDPEVVALTVALVVRSLPWVLAAWAQVRDAAHARGLERSPRATVVPFVLATVRYAQQTGEALAARGLTDSTPAPRRKST